MSHTVADYTAILKLIETRFAAPNDLIVITTARDLEQNLKAYHEREAVDLLQATGSCTKYLERLTRSHAQLFREFGRETVFDKDASGEGVYAFVTHAFADAAKGAVGLIRVGAPQVAAMAH